MLGKPEAARHGTLLGHHNALLCVRPAPPPTTTTPPPGTLLSHTLILCQDMTMGGTLDLNPPHLPAIVQLPSLEAGDQVCQVSTSTEHCRRRVPTHDPVVSPR
jgi:hypothetical protein